MNAKYREDTCKRNPASERTSAESLLPRAPPPRLLEREAKTFERAKIKTSRSSQQSFVGGELWRAKNDEKINFGQLWDYFNKVLSSDRDDSRLVAVHFWGRLGKNMTNKNVYFENQVARSFFCLEASPEDCLKKTENCVL